MKWVVAAMASVSLAATCTWLGWPDEQEAEITAPAPVAEAPAPAAADAFVPYLPPPVALIPHPVPPTPVWRVPVFVVAGILKVETRSRLLPGKNVRYVDKRRGSLGERGPTQIRPETFRQFAKPGERLEALEHNMKFALEFTERILVSYHEQTGSWKAATAAWNAGPGNVRAGYPYQARVYREGLRYRQEPSSATKSGPSSACNFVRGPAHVALAHQRYWRNVASGNSHPVLWVSGSRSV